MTYKGIKNHPTALKEAYEKGVQVVNDLERIKKAGTLKIPLFLF